MKALIVGGGSIGQRHASNILKEYKDSSVDIVTNYSSTDNKIFSDNRVKIHSEICRDNVYDLVYIASPASKHISDLHKLNTSCKKILVEKPLYSEFSDKKQTLLQED